MEETTVSGTLYEDLVAKISKMILDGAIRKGELLPSEHALCQQFGVSRTTVRCALKVLAEHKIIETIRGKGSVVIADDFPYLNTGLRAKINTYQTDFEYAIQVRQMLEPQIAFEVARKATNQDVRDLKMINDLCAEKERAGTLTTMDMRRFHLRLAKCLDNPVLTSIVELLISRCDAPEDTTLQVPNPTVKSQRQALQEHYDIFRAIRDRNCEDAYFYMKENICTFRHNCLDEF